MWGWVLLGAAPSFSDRDISVRIKRLHDIGLPILFDVPDSQ